ncbi:Hypothetical protein SRAE_X000136800 [Strongyloides ratti]|uniref:Uncharacterized protein n=1 Tax=Strongyloides ratti TaxID=34506 RepID=A0A090KWI8_STRRB|nr:Hypothetical protein SRAE_X000136800 [Strongyloides ratti]CEF59622.1 Hypothetical protein SRAE_X000136800 [Strongyloides ratti]
MIFVGLILLLCTEQLCYACIGGSSPASCCRNGCTNTPVSGCSSSRPIVGYQTQQQPQVQSQYIAPTYNQRIYAQVPESYMSSDSLYSSNNQQYLSGIPQQSFNIPQIPSQNSYISPLQNQHLQQSQYYNSGPVSQPSYTNNVPVYSGNGENAKGAIYESIQQTVSSEQTKSLNRYDTSSNININNQPSLPISKIETTKENIIPSQLSTSMVNSFTQQKEESYIPEEKNIISQSFNENIPQVSKENVEKKIVQVSPSTTHIEDSDYRDQEHETIVTSKETTMKTNIVPYTNEVMPPNPPEVGSNQLDGKVETIHVSELPPKGPDYQFQHNDKVYTQEKEENINQPGTNNEKNDEEINNAHIGETTINSNNNVIYTSENQKNNEVTPNVLTSISFEKNQINNKLEYGEKTTKQIGKEQQSTTLVESNKIIDTTISDFRNEIKENTETSTIGIIPNASEIYSPSSANVNQNTDGSIYEETTTTKKIVTSNPIIIEETSKPYRIRRIYFRHRN